MFFCVLLLFEVEIDLENWRVCLLALQQFKVSFEIEVLVDLATPAVTGNTKRDVQ